MKMTIFKEGSDVCRVAKFLDGGDAFTDASKPSKGHAGGGYVVIGPVSGDCCPYHWWTFGSAASRRPIDYLEGQTVVHCLSDNGHLWDGKVIVRFHLDNSAFQASAAKGWSHAEPGMAPSGLGATAELVAAFCDPSAFGSGTISCSLSLTWDGVGAALIGSV